MTSHHRLPAILLGLTLTLAPGSEAALPLPAGEVLLTPDPAAFKAAIWVEDKSTASFETVALTDAPFASALRLTTRKPSPEPWQIGVWATIQAPVKKGDVLWFTLHGRSLESLEPTGEAYADAVFMLRDAADKEVRPLERRFTCGKKWTETAIPFLVTEDAAAGEAKLVIRYGAAAQSFEVGGITVVNCGPAADPAELPKAGAPYVGHAADAPWRAAAAERIERHRKGDLSLRVTDAAGKPLSGATVSVRMKRHAFPWGAAVHAKRLAAAATPADTKYRETVEKHFTKVVFANDLKWGRWINQKPADRQNITDALSWLKQRDIPARGHVMVWPSWQYTPSFLRDLEKDPAALRQAVAAHIAAQTAAHPDSFTEWDVVNETYRHNDLLRILGRDIMVDWFKLARGGLPRTKLYYNDYVLFHGSTPESASQYLHDLIVSLKERGAPIDGIGEQAHFNGIPPGPAEIVAALDRFGKLGLPIQITEFDIDTPDQRMQADFTRDFLTAAFSHPSVEGIVHWEFWENPGEGNPNACLWRQDGSLRPAGQAWVDQTTKAWWTHVDGTTSTDGGYATRGFFGDYEVTVAHEGRAKTERLKLKPGLPVQTIALP